MASRHHSLDYSEVKDVTQLLEDFQEYNAVTVEVGLRLVRLGKSPRIVMIAVAYTLRTADAAPALLASAEVDTYAMNLKHWGAAVTHLLYVLDAQLAKKEMSGNG